ncbi:MAG TPA: hypothetical protein VFX70_09350 [Mycobacteriales bacterium]|nr:hypothetical protein [Mycobacteriales bacterium]
MDYQRQGGPDPHNAYRSLSRAAGRPANGAPRPDPRPDPRPWPDPPTGASAAGNVCPHCRTWPSCCFCSADPDGMRDALRRIAELHSGCEQHMCPERARLAAIPRTHRPAE